MTPQPFHATRARFDMPNTTLSLKKRVLIVLVFIFFLITLLIVSLFVKKTPLKNNPPYVTPTLVPMGAPSSAPVSLKNIEIENSPAAQNNSLGVVSFDYQTKNIPASGVVFTQAPTSIPADTISKVQEKLIAGGTERIINTPAGQVIFMQKDTKTLTIYLYSRTISYSDDSTMQSAQNTTPLASKAAEFISSLALPFDETRPTIKYFTNKTGDLTQTANPASADLIDVSFKELVQGLTVFRQYGSDAATHVWFSKEGKIKKFTYFYTPQYVPQKSIILPTLEETETKVKENKGIIVGLGDEYQQTLLQSPSKTTFTTVEVGYFSSGKSDLLFPIYVFKGDSVVGGKSLPITLYLPPN